MRRGSPSIATKVHQRVSSWHLSLMRDKSGRGRSSRYFVTAPPCDFHRPSRPPRSKWRRARCRWASPRKPSKWPRNPKIHKQNSAPSPPPPIWFHQQNTQYIAMPDWGKRSPSKCFPNWWKCKSARHPLLRPSRCRPPSTPHNSSNCWARWMASNLLRNLWKQKSSRHPPPPQAWFHCLNTPRNAMHSSGERSLSRWHPNLTRDKRRHYQHKPPVSIHPQKPRATTNWQAARRFVSTIGQMRIGGKTIRTP